MDTTSESQQVKRKELEPRIQLNTAPWIIGPKRDTRPDDVVNLLNRTDAIYRANREFT